uniref:Class A beta-lactamase-related serine hydrolase n=1 Tax=Schlesneria paludicola TaxID=360056 RepID=A0A7C4QT72_9PLAN
MPRCFWSCLAVCASWFVAAASVGAAEFDGSVLRELRGALQRFVDEEVVAGAVAVVGSKAGIAHIEAVGYQSWETKKPMSMDVLFRIASMTKPITALAVMQLQEAGRLAVHDPVENYLPEFRGQMLAVKKDNMVALVKPSRPITIRDLLTHTSGLPGGYPAGYDNLYNTRQLTLRESILLQSQRPLDFEPGSRWAYCNAGIDTLGRIVEVVSGESYSDYLTRHIFGPLEMFETTPFVRPDQRVRVAGLYEQRQGQLVAAQRPLIGLEEGSRHPVPAGGLLSTGPDLARLYQCLLNGGEWNGRRLIKPETLQEMTKVQTGDLTTGFVPGMGFGYGFAVVREPQGVTAMLSPGSYGHGGAFGTQGWLDPHQDVFVILLVQRVGLPNADGSEIRRVVQDIAVKALRKP